MKFGGTSVGNRAAIETVLSIVKARANRHPVVVCSAHKGVTDALVTSARAAAGGNHDADRVLQRQREVARSLGCSEDLLAPLYREIQDLLRGIHLVKELSPRSLDYISSFGERMSVRSSPTFLTATASRPTHTMCGTSDSSRTAHSDEHARCQGSRNAPNAPLPSCRQTA